MDSSSADVPVAMPPPSSPSLPFDDAEIRRLVADAEQLVRPAAAGEVTAAGGLEGAPRAAGAAGVAGAPEEAAVRGGRVREWLRRRHGPARGKAEHAAHASGQVTDASCDASGECTSSAGSDDERESSDSETLDCSVATCREVTTRVTGRDVTGHGGSPTASQLADSPESAPPQAALSREQRQSGLHPPTLLVITPPSHVTDLAATSSDLADPADTPTPTSSSGCSVILSCSAQSSQPTNSGAVDTPAWAGRRRVRARRPIISLSSDSERSPTLYRRRRGQRSPPAADQDMADLDQGRSFQFCATDATLEDLSQSDVVTDDACDVISSVSEQAWDPYQEYKEITDPGSEPSVDPEALRRFLDTDDYRHFIDSLSDCTSSQVSSVPPAHRPPPPRRLRRKLRAASDSLDSDTDGGDEVPAALTESRRRLQMAQTELSRRAGQQDPICSGILAACRSELGRLEQLLTLVDPLGLCRDASSPYLKPALAEIKGVIQQWAELRAAAMELQVRADGFSRLQDRVRSFRHGLVTLDEQTARAGRDVATIDDFGERINAVKALQQELADRRLELVDVNSDVHRHVTSGGQSSLKEDVATLYRIWDEVNHRAQAQLEHLSDAAATWREFEAERAALAAAMDADRRRLGLLQQAITGEDGNQTTGNGGNVTGGGVIAADVIGTGDSGTDVAGTDVARSGVAKSDGAKSDVAKSDATQNGVADGPGGPAGVGDGLTADLPLSRLTSPGHDDLSEGTSGYDSACSDDLSERERRLGRLRRMATDLETLLSPAGQAWNDITITLNTATSDLRQLQQSCRQLVVRTTAQLPADSCDGGGRRQRASPVLRRKSYAACRRDTVALSPRARAGRRGWARRVLRAALPFQLAMLLWLCAAYLLEPGCCDDLNYLARSLTPQLRYVSGPPPI